MNEKFGSLPVNVAVTPINLFRQLCNKYKPVLQTCLDSTVTPIHLFRQRCDNLGVSLASCQQQLDRDSWHPDLATEINKLRKLLSEERRSCHNEGERLKEVHQLFEQVQLG